MHAGGLRERRLLLDRVTERSSVEGVSRNPFQQGSDLVRPRGAGKIKLDGKGLTDMAVCSFENRCKAAALGEAPVIGRRRHAGDLAECGGE